MRGAILALALLACGPLEAQAMRFPPPSSGGAAEPETPVFDFNPGAGSGMPRLAGQDTTGWTTVIDCDMRDATTSNLVCDTGGTWVEADGDVIVGNAEAAPFTEEGARSAFFNGFYSYEAGDTAVGNIAANEDFHLTVVAFTVDRDATQYIVSKFDTATSQGLAISVDASGIAHALINGVTLNADDAIVEDGWFSIYDVWRDNGMCGFQVNGVLADGPTACPGAIATTTTPKNFAIGCRPNATNNDCIDGRVTNVIMRTCVACSHDGESFAAETAYRLMGVWPDVAVVPRPLATDIRSTPATLDIVRGGTTRRTFAVGPRWLRVNAVRESGVGGAVVTGYTGEVTAQNVVLRGREIDHAYWTVTAGDTINANNWVGPAINNNDFEVERYSAGADAVGVEHQITSSAITLTAGQDYLCYADFGYDGTDTTAEYGFIRTPGIESTSIGFFDIKNCVEGSGGAGLKQYASGKYGNIHAVPYGVHNGTQQHCWAGIVVVGDASADTLQIGFARTDGDTTFTTSAGEHLGAIYNPGCIAIQNGVLRPFSSAIINSSATRERIYDGLRFDIANWPADGGTILVEFMLPNTKINNGSGNPAEWLATPYKDANNYVHAKATQGTGQATLDGVCSAGGGMYFDVLNGGTHEMTVCAQPGFGQFCAVTSGLLQPGSNQLNNPHDGRVHTLRFVVRDGHVRGYYDGASEACVQDDSVTMPDLVSGRIEICYSGTDGSSAATCGPGIVKRVRIFDVEVDDNGFAT